jgi:hypothetical protein
MGKKVLLYSASLIGLYLAVAYSSGFVNDIKAAGTGSSNVIGAFQGRK